MKRTRSFFTVLAVFAMTVGAQPAFATHFDGDAETGTFDPQFSATVGGTLVSRPASLTFRSTQVDHEDAPVRALFRAPNWQLPVATMRQGETAAAATATRCKDTVNNYGNSPNGTGVGTSLDFSKRGDAYFARAEIVGTGLLAAAADGVSRPGEPIVWNANVGFIRWNGAQQKAMLCLLLITTDTRVKQLPDSNPEPGDDSDDIEGIVEIIAEFEVQKVATASGHNWEVDADLTDLVDDETLQTLNASLIELTSTLNGHSSGNWITGGVDFSVLPATSISNDLTAAYTPCVTPIRNCNTKFSTVVRTVPFAATLPAPSLTTPGNNSTSNTNAVTVGGTSDPGATVRVYNAGVSLGEVIADGSGAWSGPFSIPDGDHVLTSRVVDDGGQSALSNAASIHVDAPPAAPSVATPTEGETLGAGPVVVTGSAQAGSTVKVYEGLTSLGTTTAAANGSWSKSIPFTVKGAHSIVATATDLGGEGAPSVARGFTITTETPVFTSPVNNAATNDGNVTITGTAEAGATVAVSLGGSPLASVVADPSGAWSLPQVLADGDYTYDATSTAIDTTVSLPAAPLTITVDTVAPAVPTIDAPAEGVEVNSALAPFSGTGEPNATIVLFKNGVQAATATVTPAGTWTKGVIVSDGAYAFTALARDRAGNDSALTDARNITVVIPVEITTPVADSLNPRTTLVTVVGDASAGNARIYEGTKLLANAIMKNGVAKASINFTTGAHTIYARTVSGGSVGAPSPSVTFQVDATPPTVTYTDPGSTLPVTPTAIISGAATDAGSVISGVARINVEFRNWVNTLEGTGEATCVGCTGPAVTWTMPRPAGVLPGLHKIRIWATDDRGNVSASVYANVLIP